MYVVKTIVKLCIPVQPVLRNVKADVGRMKINRRSWRVAYLPASVVYSPPDRQATGSRPCRYEVTRCASTDTNEGNICQLDMQPKISHSKRRKDSDNNRRSQTHSEHHRPGHHGLGAIFRSCWQNRITVGTSRIPDTAIAAAATP